MYVASIKNAAGNIAYNMMTYWSGNQTNPSSNYGLYNGPYYYWEAGGMWGAMIDYWHLTGDTSYLDVMVEAIYAQASPTMDFKMPAMVAQLVSLGHVQLDEQAKQVAHRLYCAG